MATNLWRSFVLWYITDINREVAIGCGDELGVWETETGAQVQDFSSRITTPGTTASI